MESPKVNPAGHPNAHGQWLDDLAKQPIPESQAARGSDEDAERVSTLCQACHAFFSGPKQWTFPHRHLRFLESFRSAAGRGCHLCAVVQSRIDDEAQAVGPDEELQLMLLNDRRLSQDTSSMRMFWNTDRASSKDGKPKRIMKLGMYLTQDPNISPSGAALAPWTGSKQSREVSLGWVTKCTENHEVCNTSHARPQWMPLRLLEIGETSESSDISTVRLLQSAALPPKQKYVVLSHCWGASVPLRLLTSNLAALEASIPLSTLPRTFREAVLVCQQWLHVSYLWVDALCIIQDDPDDWRQQCAEMQYVYGNAWCTIAATGAVDSAEGLFFERDPRLATLGSVNLDWEGDDKYSLPKTGPARFFTDASWKSGLFKSPLYRRAWTLQERWLSRRILHFGRESLFFECGELEASEMFPNRLPPMLIDFDRTIHRMSSSLALRQIPASKAQIYEDWFEVTTVYAACGLTNAEDKLMALAGVAAEFAVALGDRYIAGLWESNLVIQLLWYVDHSMIRGPGKRSRRSPVYRGPSWSWVSIEAPISFSELERGSIHARVLDTRIELVDERTPFGQVKGGAIEICGTLWPEADERDEGSPKNRAISVGGGKIVWASTTFDTKKDQTAATPRSIQFSPIAFADDQFWLDGLILRPVSKEKRVFKRVGKFTVESLDDEFSLVGIGTDTFIIL